MTSRGLFLSYTSPDSVTTIQEMYYRETRVHRPAGRGRSAAQALCDWGCSSDCRDRRPIGEEEAGARGWARPCDWLTRPEEEEKEERRSGERKVHPVQARSINVPVVSHPEENKKHHEQNLMYWIIQILPLRSADDHLH